ncbi:MAG: hypothetical protein MGF17_01105 [Trichodesmium sp. MAG_R04]|nr:hypothetical protein [Trichodesmium sp. MAG_R04]
MSINLAVLQIICSMNIWAAGLVVSVYGAIARPEESKSWETGAMKQKAPKSDARECCPVS